MCFLFILTLAFHGIFLLLFSLYFCWRLETRVSNNKLATFVVCHLPLYAFFLRQPKSGEIRAKAGITFPRSSCLVSFWHLHHPRMTMCCVRECVCVCVRAATSVSGLADSQFRRVDLLRLQFSPGSPST